MAQSSFPQCRREGVQYRISTTENAQEEIWYSQNEIPIAMFTQRYQPHLGDHIPIHWHQEMQLLWVYDGTLSYRVNGMEFPLDRSQLLFINDSRKLLDDAGFPQVFRPGQAGRGGKSDFFGKLQIGDRCVGLQLPQDRLIAVIQ